MTTDRLINALRQHAIQSDTALSGIRKGIVTAFDQDQQAAKVAIQPENVETGYIQVGAVWAGNGFGLFAPPSIGDQVEVNFEDGNSDNAHIGHKFHSDADKPLSVPSGELWMQHKSGSYVKLTNDTNLSLLSQMNLLLNATQNIQATASQIVQVTAPNTNIQGNLNVKNGYTGIIKDINGKLVYFFNGVGYNTPQAGN